MPPCLDLMDRGGVEFVFEDSYISFMTVSIELPDTIIGVDARYLKEALIAALYSNGKLSEMQARKVLGMTRRAFEDMLPRYGFSILIDSSENLDIELGA